VESVRVVKGAEELNLSQLMIFNVGKPSLDEVACYNKHERQDFEE
jgi:hypothetical protein